MAIQLTEPGAPVAVSKYIVALGIDLGTTNSAVAILKEGVPSMILDQAGHSLTPSVVDYGGEFPVVGHAALVQHNQGVPSTVASIKRLLDPDAATLDLFQARYNMAINSAPGALSRLTVGDKILNPIQISSDILHHLKVQAEKALGQDISYAVITVPAYFSEAARSATRLAAKMAGLKVLRLLNEPTAAAVAYGLDAQKTGLFFVYDLGGGTFDVSILNLEEGVFQVIATDGLATLGGDNIDQLIVEDILKKCPDIAPSQKTLKELSAKARAVKEHLSHAENGQWDIVIGDQIFAYTLTRADLEKLLQPFLLSTMEIVERALKAAKISADKIEEVLLVGGSTRIPVLKKALERFFKRAPKDTIDPDQIVAQGAAVQAHALTHGSDTLLLDVTPLSLGLETMGGIVEKILPRNTPIPAAVSQEFTTYQDGQTALSLHIVQGEREFSKDCRSLGKFSLTGIPPMLAGVPRIEITFTLDADGLLTVNAIEQETGLLQQIEIAPSHGLTEDEIHQMIQSSHKHGADDITARLATDAEVKERKMAAALKRL